MTDYYLGALGLGRPIRRDGGPAYELVGPSRPFRNPGVPHGAPPHVRHDLETSSAMPAPWVSAFGPGRGWDTRAMPTRVGPSLGALWRPTSPIHYMAMRSPVRSPAARPPTSVLRARSASSGRGRLGQWDDVVAWEEYAGDGGGGYEPTSWESPDVGYEPTSWYEPPSAEWQGEESAPTPVGRADVSAWEMGWGGGDEESAPVGRADVSAWEMGWGAPGAIVERAVEYTDEQLRRAAATLVGPLPAGADSGPNAIERFLVGIAGAAPALLKGLFPAGLPPVWTPCPRGTYWNGRSCSISPTSCPEGTYWTGSGCSRVGGFRWPWEGGGEGSEESGRDEGGFFRGGAGALFRPQVALTQQPWFWPVVLGGGALVVIVAVRRR